MEPSNQRIFERVTYEFVLRADSPIAHHAEVFGNSAQIVREKIRLPDGSFALVPIVSGDAMRHGLREADAYTVLDACGLLEGDGQLTESALRLKFSGGLITGGGAGAVKLDEYREMVSLDPGLGLLGGCAQNRAIPGKIQVEAAMLICEETAHKIPAWAVDVAGELTGACEHIEKATRVRMDPTLDPAKRLMLAPAEHHRSNQRLLASEAASEAKDAVEKRDSKSSMMPRSFETVVTGSLFFWRVTMTFNSELERECGQAMIASFLSNAIVGGKRGTGCGRLTPLRLRDEQGDEHIAGREVQHYSAATTAEVATAAMVAPGKGSRIFDHYRAHKDRIREMLATVVA